MKMWILFLSVSFVLSGCVSNSPDQLFSATHNQPLGSSAKQGQYPKIGYIPKGQTNQLSDAEAANLKNDLRQSVQRNNNIGTEQNSKAEIDKLRRAAIEEQNRRIKEIETGKSDL